MSTLDISGNSDMNNVILLSAHGKIVCEQFNSIHVHKITPTDCTSNCPCNTMASPPDIVIGPLVL